MRDFPDDLYPTTAVNIPDDSIADQETSKHSF